MPIEGVSNAYQLAQSTAGNALRTNWYAIKPSSSNRYAGALTRRDSKLIARHGPWAVEGLTPPPQVVSGIRPAGTALYFLSLSAFSLAVHGLELAARPPLCVL